MMYKRVEPRQCIVCGRWVTWPLKPGDREDVCEVCVALPVSELLKILVRKIEQSKACP